MKLFVGFGYNDRDRWIEQQVFPILRGMGFTVVDGKDMHGQVLHTEVKSRIEQSDAAIGFFTIREGQEGAEFNSHLWVQNELLYAVDKEKLIIPINEVGVSVPPALLGERQHIELNQNDRLACVAELVRVLGRRDIRRLRLSPSDDQLSQKLQRLRRTQGFVVRYRTQDLEGLESQFRTGRLEQVDQAFYLNVFGVPRRAYVEVEGVLNQVVEFSSGWVSADAVQVPIG